MSSLEGEAGDADPGAGDPTPEPGGAGAAGLRASDADRERTASILTQQGAAGRLDPDECAHRLAAAFAARTLPELYALTADLPYPDAVVPGAAVPGAAGWTAPGRSETLLARLLHLWARK